MGSAFPSVFPLAEENLPGQVDTGDAGDLPSRGPDRQWVNDGSRYGKSVRGRVPKTRGGKSWKRKPNYDCSGRGTDGYLMPDVTFDVHFFSDLMSTD